MTESLLRPSDDVGQADWIRQRVAPFDAYTVSMVVPGGFPAYVRVFHPAYDGARVDRPLRWADVAERARTTMHALADFDSLLGREDDDEEEDEWDLSDPDTGSLQPELLAALCEILSRHTATPSSCWFCLWSGYGFHHPAAGFTEIFMPTGVLPSEATPAPLPEPPLVVPWDVRRGPRPSGDRRFVELPAREYLLFSGPLEAALELGEKYRRGIPQSPNLFWPEDHAWCVASEIDLDSTYIGGSEALIEAICADPRLEAWRVQPDDPITADSDLINGGDGD